MKVNAGLQINTETKLKRIAEASVQNKTVFSNVMHLFSRQGLHGCFRELDGRKALGIDGISKEKYKEELDDNIDKLVEKIHSMTYLPQPVRQVLIPKECSRGKTRPLGISNFEDKLFQKMMQKVLESIFEPWFINQSYGFRPGRGCQTAIKALYEYLFRTNVETVIDVDISDFFGSINHNMLLEMLKDKISDKRFLRYIVRMFKAGVLSKGEFTVSDEGVPQGSVCSPVLANIFAHNVIDVWFEEMVKPRCAGHVEIFRYADDVVIVCQFSTDAKRIATVLGKRLAKYKLELNKEKTKLINFSKANAGKGMKQGSFDFLGFTWYLGRSRRGYTIPKLKTCGKRMRAKLKKANDWARHVSRKLEVGEMWRACCDKLRGHIQYYGVSYNSKRVAIFRDKVKRIMFKWINRKSQKQSMTWEEFTCYERLNPLPKPVIYFKLF